MIITKGFQKNHLSRFFVNPFPYNLTAAVDGSFFTDETLVFGLYMIFKRLWFIRAEFSVQIFTVAFYQKLVCSVCIIAHPIIHIVIHYGGTGTEWYLPPEIWEKIESVVMMVLRYGKLGMQHQPVYQIGKLAHPPSDSGRNLSVGYG